jgi:hypothetical protein
VSEYGKSVFQLMQEAQGLTLLRAYVQYALWLPADGSEARHQIYMWQTAAYLV